jgi:DNA invertase Pin-like site-specific DNA recombinase
MQISWFHPPMLRAALYYRNPTVHPSTEIDLRKAVGDRGGVVVATYSDDDGSPVRARNAGWKSLLANLDGFDEMVVPSAGDLPGRNVRNLLAILGTLRDHGVSLHLEQEGINTRHATASDLIDLIAAYRSVKLSRAIRAGQAKALEAGKRIGRPAIPYSVVVGIQRSLAGGAGVRWTARRFGVSPGSIVNIRRSMATNAGLEAG